MAFALRIWGIWNATSTDEYNEVFEALRVCSGNLNMERWFKRFYLYILSIEYSMYYLVGWAFNLFQSPLDFAIKIVRDMNPLFIMGRTTSALLGTGTVLVTYLVGKVLFNKTTGLLSALFLCLNVVNIELSHYARVDACFGFLCMTTFYFIAQIYSNKNHSKPSWYILAGIFLGCAFQNKPQAVLLFLPFCYAHFYTYKFKELFKGIFEKKIFLFIMGGILGIVIGNPAVLFAPIKFFNSLLGLGQVYTTPLNEVRSEIGFIVYARYFYKELGILMSLVAVLGVIQLFFSDRKKFILIVTFMAPFYFVMGASVYMVSSSYMIPFMPFLYLFIANCLQCGIVYFRKLKWLKTAIGITVITVCLMIQPLINVIRYEQSLAGANTRVLAKEWIEKNIPFGSTILMDSGKTINSSAPLIAMNEKAIDRIYENRKKALNEGTLEDTTKMVDDKSLRYYEMLRKTVPKESYDITSTGFGLEVNTIDYYVSKRFQYFIISDHMKRSRTASFFAERRPKVANFYKALDFDPRIERIKTISASSINYGGTFHIYKIKG